MMLQDMCLPVIVAKFTIWSDGDHIKDEISGQKEFTHCLVEKQERHKPTANCDVHSQAHLPRARVFARDRFRQTTSQPAILSFFTGMG